VKRPSETDATYELVIRGELDERYGYLFEGMHMQRVTGTTVITGRVRDQAHLHGLIERTEELGLALISVQQISANSAGNQERDRA
jgi:hypothetical protein